jgi:outer membrane immunogenic protein
MKSIFIAAVAIVALIGTPALAADMPLKAPLPPPPAWSWTGFYLGINGGYSLANDPFNQFVNPTFLSSVNSRVTPQGGLFGGQAGYNYQTGNIVLGVEGDLQWANEHDTAGCGIECFSTPSLGIANTFATAEQRINWFGTARGRIGWANDGWLMYVTGGGAWGGIDATTAGSVNFPIAGAFSNTTSFTKSGWVFGGGTEVRIAGPWTAKFEYLYMDLGSISDTQFVPAPLGPLTLTTNSHIHDNIVRVGLNYTFDSGPGAATSEPAVAVNMPVKMPLKAPPLPAAPVYNWTGFYAGIDGGYSLALDPFNQIETVSPPGFAPSSSSSTINSRVTPQGGLFGGQVGYNYQTGNIVLGVEGDLQWADEHDTAGCGQECVITGPGTGLTFGTAEQRIEWFGTARGRIGWANNGWLMYITGGGAWGGIDATTAESGSGPPATAFSNTTGFTKSGWVFGGGTEVRIAGPWTAKFEYLYMDLGSISDTLPFTTGAGVPGTLTTNSHIHDNIVRAGLNYEFNWGGPVAAKY